MQLFNVIGIAVENYLAAHAVGVVSIAMILSVCLVPFLELFTENK